MADKKISALPAGATLPAGSLIPFVDTTGSPFVTKHINWADTQVTTIAYPALQVLISGGNLIPGMIYKITGFNKNMPIGGPANPNGFLPISLYDDGTNSGITIYMQALSTTELSDSGHGEFYNPKYAVGASTYYNIDGTGLYQIWDGNNPESAVPSYSVNDVVFWGGYAWRNLLGNVGTATNSITLDSTNWVKLPYSNTTYYTKVVDEIKVDWQHGVVTERTNTAYNISVKWSLSCYATLSYYDLRINPISVIPWGLYGGTTVDNYQFGMSSLTVNDGYVDLINFKGVSLTNNYFGTQSTVHSNYFGIDTYVSENVVDHNSIVTFNTFTYTTFSYNTLDSSSSIQGNTGVGNSFTLFLIRNELLNNCQISNNTLSLNGFIWDNKLSVFSIIGDNTLSGNSYITNNILTNNAQIYNNIVSGSSSINNNVINKSFVSDSFLTIDSSISDNQFDNADVIQNSVDSDSDIKNNQVSHSSLRNSLITSSCSIEYNVITSRSDMAFNTMNDNCKINGNTLNSESYMNSNTLTNGSSIAYNSLSYSYFDTNSLTDSSRIEGNISSTSGIYSSVLNSSASNVNNSLSTSVLTGSDFAGSGTGFFNNILVHTTFDFSITGTMLGSIVNISANGYSLFGPPPNFSTATYIFQAGSKNVFVSSDGRPLISFVDLANVIQIYDIDA